MAPLVTKTTCRQYWAAGRCPCCGAELGPWTWDGVEHATAAVAEGVMFCGRCIANEHTEPPEVLAAILAAIAAGHDGPLEQLMIYPLPSL